MTYNYVQLDNSDYITS